MANSSVKSSSAKAPEIIILADNVDEVCCDGGTGAMGHPVVFYSFDKQDQVACGYCGRLFVKERASYKYK